MAGFTFVGLAPIDWTPFGPFKARKRPVVVEAMRYVPEHFDLLMAWLSTGDVIVSKVEDEDPDAFGIETLEGVMTVRPWDFVIKGVQGEFYPCKPDIFLATYESAAD